RFSANAFINKKCIQIASKLRRLMEKKEHSFFNVVFHNIRREYDHQYKVFDMSDPAFIQKAKRNILFAKGWHYRDTTTLKKHADVIRKTFTPKDQLLKEVNDVLAETANY